VSQSLTVINRHPGPQQRKSHGRHVSVIRQPTIQRIRPLVGSFLSAPRAARPRHQVAEMAKQKLFDSREREICTREAVDMKDHNVSKGHRNRRERLQAHLNAYLQNLPGLLRFYERNYSPGTAKGYASTLIKQNPHLVTQVVRDAQDRLRQKAPLLQSKRARPITPEEFLRLLSRAPLGVRVTAVTMLLSASRHMDLYKVIRFKMFQRAILLLQWANQKSDRYGMRAIAKFIYIPSQYENLVINVGICTYRELYNELKKIDPALTVHSIRRSAATYLAEAGFSMAHIQLLTGHTPSADPHLAVRQYVDPSPNQPESQLQIRMSRTLARTFHLCT